MHFKGCVQNPSLLTLSKHREPCDFHLITRTQNGETEAFGWLVRKYQSRVYNQILRSVKNPEVAKDLTQETWLKAFRGIQTFRCESAFYSWVYRIAENIVKDHFRREKHVDTIEPLDPISQRRITQTHPCPSRDIERQELREYLSAAIAHLTPIRRRVFLLYYVEELSIKAIAAEIGRSEGTIKSHLRNARASLRQMLLEGSDICLS